MPYPPTFNLHRVDADGSRDVQVTFGDLSYIEPDVHASGRVVAARIRSMEKISVDGGPRIAVRDDRNSAAPSVGRDVLYFAAGVTVRLGSWD